MIPLPKSRSAFSSTGAASDMGITGSLLNPILIQNARTLL